MNKLLTCDENISELADAELGAVTGGAEAVCSTQRQDYGACKIVFSGAEVWNQFATTAGVPGARM
ncbi:hypothetical protein [Bradyrhizobium sp. CCBAU 51627]|uniref:hypothetical protein n=1 Tax=Bradyrhizobium sp. CCBAU 51627 TaxID=1325088 RepID=UPI00230534E5|nr:hypothetical protein [Bradyrhizobium sp. CCBAU 51627]MDA9433929.1 hypothetical protein [Bradyrhizobium sp. CCBAU 51627]